MSAHEDSDDQFTDLVEIKNEIDKYKTNPDTRGMFVSGWDDADEDVEIVKDPTANPVEHALWAAENGELDTLRELITSDEDLIQVQDSDGYTLLHRAAYGNHLEAVSYLLSRGASVTIKTELGWTALHSACNWNNYQVAARLLAAGSDPGALSDGGQTPMHLISAISHSKSTLLILLLRDDSVDIARKRNKSGETPEELAKRHGVNGPLFDMVHPAASYIQSLAFTCNPFVRETMT